MNNVIPLRTRALPPLGVASTATAGRRLAGSRNEVWLCQAYDSNSQGIMLYVKPGLGLRRILIEALAAQVGQCMGLPCPTPYIVTANPAHIGAKAGRKLIAFGSEQVGRLTYPIMNTEVLMRALDSHKLTDALCAFDEFIANAVRGPRDIIIDPVHGPFIIDHEGAMEAATKPGDSVTNWLAGRVLERIEEKQRPLFLKRLRAKASALRDFEMGPIPAAVQFDQNGVEVYKQLLEFLRTRLVELDRLLSQRVLPQQAYVQNVEDEHASGRAP